MYIYPQLWTKDVISIFYSYICTFYSCMYVFHKVIVWLYLYIYISIYLYIYIHICATIFKSIHHFYVIVLYVHHKLIV